MEVFRPYRHRHPFLPLHQTFLKKNLFVSPQVRKMMPQIAEKEVVRIHASQVDPFLSQVIKKALSNGFLAGSDAANDGWKTSSYHFVAHILTQMVTTGGLDNIFDRRVERRMLPRMCKTGCSLAHSWKHSSDEHSSPYNFSAQLHRSLREM